MIHAAPDGKGRPDMTEKHLVTCPRCGFGVTDQGDASNPGLTGDIRAFTRICDHTNEVLGSVQEQPFGCPELLEAVHDAALSDEASTEAPHDGRPGARLGQQPEQ
jgi:hypothetical protein